MTSGSMPLKAVLFDLDNTLILFDETRFFQEYMPHLARSFSDLIHLDTFRTKIITSTQALIDNDGTTSNLEVFMRTFADGLNVGRDEVHRRFDRFYEKEFDRFRTLAQTVEEGVDVILELQKIGLMIIIASNPVWPLHVQEKRLAWAGLSEIEFDWITHIENSSSCKPHLRYYNEICAHLNVAPENCLMVGNDPVNDMVAGLCGMKTFLATDGEASDHVSLAMSREIQEGALPEPPPPDFIGNLSEVPGVVRTLIG